MSEVVTAVDAKAPAVVAVAEPSQANGTPPYSLKTLQINTMLQHAVEDIRSGGNVAAERAIKVIDGLAQAVKERTVHINGSDALEIVKKLEEHIQGAFSRTAAASAEYRAQFIESVSNLALQVIGNAAWASDQCTHTISERRHQLLEAADKASARLQENAERVTENVTNTVHSAEDVVKVKINEGSQGLSSTIATVDGYMHQWLADVAQKHPKTAATVHHLMEIPGQLTSAEGRQGIVEEVQHSLDENIVQPVTSTTTSAYHSASTAAAGAYNAAAHVVEGAVEQARPYVNQAADASKPYLDRAADLSKPYVQKAAEVMQPYTDR